MNNLFLSIIFWIALSNNINASEQSSTQKSSWSWPVLRAIGIVKTQKQTNTAITLKGLTKNLSANSLRQSIAEDGFDHGEDEETVVSTPTNLDKSHNNTLIDSTLQPTSPAKALTILHPNDIRETETQSPLRSSALLEAMIITDKQTTSSASWSPESKTSPSSDNKIKTMETSDSLDKIAVEKKLQELPPFNKKPLPPKKSTLIQRLFLDDLDDAFSDSETDGGQPTPVNNTNKLIQKNGSTKNFIDLEAGRTASSTASDSITKKEPETSSICNNLTSLCSSCFKKKNYKQ
jgi:hypothetical protein